MTYAVIAFQGKQYKVEQGQTLTVDLVGAASGDKVEVTDVLLVSEGKNVKVGTPLVDKAQVTLKVVESGRDKKLRVFKYKSKSKYRKTIGHRQSISNVEVVAIKG
jgi:large subunit ribosomal protein L21